MRIQGVCRSATITMKFTCFQDQSATFILPDQIDEAIEEALANPTDFNFAIDLRENIYYGRRTEPKTKQLPDSGGDKAQSQLGPN